MFGGSGEEKEEKRGRGQSLIYLTLSLSPMPMVSCLGSRRVTSPVDQARSPHRRA